MPPGIIRTGIGGVPRRNAVIRVAVVEVDCPYCGEGIGAPDNGSFQWPVALLRGPIHCDGCGKDSPVPMRYAGLA